MKLEEILKAAGWSDADIAAVGPMLADQRFRDSLEKQYGAVATERDQFKERDATWQRLKDEEWQPRVSAEERKAQEYRMKVAELEEQLNIAREYGYLTPEAEAKAKEKIDATKIAANGFDPSKYVSMEDAGRMLEAEGRAIAMAADINNEYTKLTGNSLYDYETEIDGRNMRGLSALREEAKAKRINLDQYVAQKFDFQGKRAAMATKRQQDHDDAIRKDAEEKVRAEMAAQFGNPLMRSAVPSRHPVFEPAKNGKQPWEVSAQERKAARLSRAMEVQLTGKAN